MRVEQKSPFRKNQNINPRSTSPLSLFECVNVFVHQQKYVGIHTGQTLRGERTGVSGILECVFVCVSVHVPVCSDTVLSRLKEFLSLSEVKWQEGVGEKERERGERNEGGSWQTGLMTKCVCVCVCISGGEVCSVVMSDIKHTAAT